MALLDNRLCDGGLSERGSSLRKNASVKTSTRPYDRCGPQNNTLKVYTCARTHAASDDPDNVSGERAALESNFSANGGCRQFGRSGQDTEHA